MALDGSSPTLEHRQTQPDSPGLWHFTGTVYIPDRHAFNAMELLLDAWPLLVVQVGDNLIVTDPDSGVIFDGEWIGMWEKIT